MNLETANISQDGTAITIELDPAYIISNEPDMEESGVLEENNNVLNPIQVEDVDEFLRLCIERSESEAVEEGLLNDARAEAEERLTDLFFVALGEDYTVNYEWREDPAETEAAPDETAE